MKTYSIRGATSISADNEKEIKQKSVELFQRILKDNELKKDDIVNLIISTTDDIRSFYPARAVRESGFDIPLFSAIEPKIKNSLPLCIRMMLTVQVKDKKFEPKNVYLNSAKNLKKPTSSQKTTSQSRGVMPSRGAVHSKGVRR
ncbi:MAG: chorismate mutase [Firmicutes bacterium]|nr:chorismate mutase [Bacillota bacterium]MCL2256079.1 chorismate mutase [Bacillota bacterium]